MKKKHHEVKDGSVAIPIYEFSDGRFCVDATLGGRRKRIARTSLDAAKLVARKLLAQVAAGRQGEDLLSMAEAEEYRLAKDKVAEHGVPLLTALDEWISLKTKKAHFISKGVAEIVQELLETKIAEGVSQRHLEDRRSRLNRFAIDFPCPIDRVTPGDIESWLKRLKIASRTKNNYRSALQQLFRFAQSKRYLSRHEPLAIHDIAEIRVKEGAIEIYKPAELETLLRFAPPPLLPFFLLGAFAGLRSQEVMRLEWQDIRFHQNVIEIAAAKAKTASRRLVPILPVLREWLHPLRKDTGRILPFHSYTPFERCRSAFCKSGMRDGDKTIKFKWKSNALRHSYASYRLADVKDAARVALEMGNSPSMLFRNYRELVTEQQAKEWFTLMPDAVNAASKGFSIVA